MSSDSIGYHKPTMPPKTSCETIPSTWIIQAQGRVQHLPLSLPHLDVGATLKSFRSNDRRLMCWWSGREREGRRGGGGGVCITQFKVSNIGPLKIYRVFFV